MKRLPLHVLLALLGLGLAGCPTADDDDDSAADDDDSAGDDDDSVGDDDDDDDWYAVVTHAAFGGDATVATIEGGDRTVDDDLLGLAGSDWVLAVADGDPWVIGRFFIDTVRRYEGLDFSAPSLEFSTGAGTNPQDLAVCGGRLFVTRYDLNDTQDAGGDVGIFDLATGGPLGAVDLSAYNPHADGTPEPAAIVAVGDTVYTVLQKFDRDNGWAADPAGTLLAIDCATGTVTDDWAVGSNPRLSPVQGEPTKLQIRHAAGVSMFDTVSEQLDEVVVTSDLGANYETLALAVSGDHAILVAEVDFADNEVWCLDLVAGTDTLLTTVPHRNYGAFAAPDGTVWSLWRDHWATDMAVEDGGVTVYDPVSCTEVTSTWMSFASDPSALTFYEATE